MPQAASSRIELPGLPFKSPPRPVHWSWWLVTALAISCVYWWFRRTANAPVAFHPASNRDFALQRLERLRQQQRTSRVELQQEAIAASGILREFLAVETGIQGFEMTDRELLAAMDRCQVRTGQRQALHEFAVYSDQMKFQPCTFTAVERQAGLDALATFLRSADLPT